MLGSKTCCGFVGNGVVAKISSSAKSTFPDLLPFTSFVLDGLCSCNGDRFGPVRLSGRLGVFIDISY